MRKLVCILFIIIVCVCVGAGQFPGELAWVLKGLSQWTQVRSKAVQTVHAQILLTIYAHFYVSINNSHEKLTVIREISGLQELGGEGTVGVLVRLLVSRLSVLPVAAPKRTFLGGARRDPPPSVEDQKHKQLREPPQRNHCQIMSTKRQQRSKED